MHWNHRVVRKTEEVGDGYDVIYQFAEVYYNDDTRQPYAYNEPFFHGEGIEELTILANQLLAATMKPVLNHEDFTWECGPEGDDG